MRTTRTTRTTTATLSVAARTTRDEDDDELYPVDDIVSKETRDGVVGYIVRWEGVDGAGQPWPDSWEPADNVSGELARV